MPHQCCASVVCELPNYNLGCVATLREQWKRCWLSPRWEQLELWNTEWEEEKNPPAWFNTDCKLQLMISHLMVIMITRDLGHTTAPSFCLLSHCFTLNLNKWKVNAFMCFAAPGPPSLTIANPVTNSVMRPSHDNTKPNQDYTSRFCKTDAFSPHLCSKLPPAVSWV